MFRIKELSKNYEDKCIFLSINIINIIEYNATPITEYYFKCKILIF